MFYVSFLPNEACKDVLYRMNKKTCFHIFVDTPVENGIVNTNCNGID